MPVLWFLDFALYTGQARHERRSDKVLPYGLKFRAGTGFAGDKGVWNVASQPHIRTFGTRATRSGPCL